MRPAIERLLARPASCGLRALIQAPPSVPLSRRCPILLPRRRHAFSSAATNCDSVLTHPTSNVPHRARYASSLLAPIDCASAEEDTLKARLPESIVRKLQHAPLPKDISQAEAGAYNVFIDWLKNPTSANAAKLKIGRKSRSVTVPDAWNTLGPLLAADSAGAKEAWGLFQATKELNLPLQKRGCVFGGDPEAMRTSGTAMMWAAFFDLGAAHPEIMDDISQYLTERYTSKVVQYPEAIPRQLLLLVVEHLLLNAQSDKAKHIFAVWSQRHKPTPEEFGRLLAGLITEESGNVDSAALKEMYSTSGIRGVYEWAIPLLLHRGTLYDSFEWHMFFKGHGDYSPSEGIRRPLTEHFPWIETDCCYTSSGGVTSPNVPASGSHTHISDLEILEHVVEAPGTGSTARQARDKWIARLFATTWISLDISIHSVHALGTDILGPLSLQAIALREPAASDIAKRLEQLREQGISIGAHVYSRALASFAQRRQDDLLQALLKSDLDPYLSDAVLRDHIQQSEDAGEWQQARFLRAIQQAEAVDPVAERYNYNIRKGATHRNYIKTVRTLEIMRLKKIPVEQASIRRICKAVLRPREAGRRPDVWKGSYLKKDVDLTISILKMIMSFNYVPPKMWDEVTRRLGMVGRIDDLHSISQWLADAYDPKRHAIADNGLAKQSIGLGGNVQCKPSHDFHPFHILFGHRRQAALVEWSFIHGMEAFAKSIKDGPELAQMTPRDELKKAAIKNMLRGVYFLKQLAQRGVYVKDRTVRYACYERFVIMYGKGLSSKRYNRAVRLYNPVTLQELAQAVEEAWGKTLWEDKKLLERNILHENGWSATPPSSKRRQGGIAGWLTTHSGEEVK